MWWYRNTTENAHSHLLNHSANAFWGAPTDGNRWSDERNRELTAHLDPAYVKRLSNSPRPITLKMDEPARPLPIVGMQDHTRLTLQRKRATRMGNVAVTPDNEANWKRLGLEKVQPLVCSTGWTWADVTVLEESDARAYWPTLRSTPI